MEVNQVHTQTQVDYDFNDFTLSPSLRLFYSRHLILDGKSSEWKKKENSSSKAEHIPYSIDDIR